VCVVTGEPRCYARPSESRVRVTTLLTVFCAWCSSLLLTCSESPICTVNAAVYYYQDGKWEPADGGLSMVGCVRASTSVPVCDKRPSSGTTCMRREHSPLHCLISCASA
jgi:hypothetical protein